MSSVPSAVGDGATDAWDAVLFDLDGTLADTVELILRCYRHTMRTHRGRTLPDERWLATIGRPLRDQLLEFADSSDEAREMLETYVEHQHEIHDGMVRAFDGAADVVEHLREAGAGLAIVTSKKRDMALRTLAGCGLGGRFDIVVTADDVELGKPNPEAVRMALRGLGVSEGRRVVFVGDSPYDLRAGRAAGVRTAAALWGPYGREALEAERPHYWLRSLHEVTALRP